MAAVWEWVELDDLVCPGCAAPVADQPPATMREGEPVLGWSHRDGSPLCGQPHGAPVSVEPVEARAGWSR